MLRDIIGTRKGKLNRTCTENLPTPARLLATAPGNETGVGRPSTKKLICKEAATRPSTRIF